MSTDNALRKLLAKSDISELVHRYSIATDSGCYDDLAALFDPEMDSPKWGTGPEGVKKYFFDGYKWAVGEGFVLEDFLEFKDKHPMILHAIANHQCDFVDDDHAVGVVYMVFVLGSEDGAKTVAGIFVDDYVRRDERWYFADRINALLQLNPGESSEYDSETLRLEADPNWVSLPAAWKIYRTQRERIRTGAEYQPMLGHFYQYPVRPEGQLSGWPEASVLNPPSRFSTLSPPSDPAD
jgi:hypothetical protein